MFGSHYYSARTISSIQPSITHPASSREYIFQNYSSRYNFDNTPTRHRSTTVELVTPCVRKTRSHVKFKVHICKVAKIFWLLNVKPVSRDSGVGGDIIHSRNDEMSNDWLVVGFKILCYLNVVFLFFIEDLKEGVMDFETTSTKKRHSFGIFFNFPIESYCNHLENWNSNFCKSSTISYFQKN